MITTIPIVLTNYIFDFLDFVSQFKFKQTCKKFLKLQPKKFDISKDKPCPIAILETLKLTELHIMPYEDDYFVSKHDKTGIDRISQQFPDNYIFVSDENCHLKAKNGFIVNVIPNFNKISSLKKLELSYADIVIWNTIDQLELEELYVCNTYFVKKMPKIIMEKRCINNRYDQCADFVLSMPSLKKLTIYNCRGLHKNIFDVNLEYLEIYNSFLPDLNMTNLKTVLLYQMTISNLNGMNPVHLELHDCNCINANPDAPALNFKHMTNLKTLILKNCIMSGMKINYSFTNSRKKSQEQN